MDFHHILLTFGLVAQFLYEQNDCCMHGYFCMKCTIEYNKYVLGLSVEGIGSISCNNSITETVRNIIIMSI